MMSLVFLPVPALAPLFSPFDKGSGSGYRVCELFQHTHPKSSSPDNGLVVPVKAQHKDVSCLGDLTK